MYESKFDRSGFLTNTLTNEKGYIYGILKDQYINFPINDVEMRHHFYWSDVYVYGRMAVLINKGILLCDVSGEELMEYHKKSKENFQYCSEESRKNHRRRLLSSSGSVRRGGKRNEK